MRTGGGASSNLEARIGKVLIAKNLRVGDILREWDDDNSGTIDADELHTHLKRLGLNPTKKESYACPRLTHHAFYSAQCKPLANP